MTRWIDELEQQARQRLSPGIYEYYRQGAGQELSLPEAESGWDALRLRPRVLRDVATVSTRTTVLGTELATPILVAPMAMQFEADPDAEVATATGTANAGSLMCVSSTITVPYRTVRDTGAPWWAQVYVFTDRGLTRELLVRAREAGAGAIVLTADTPLLGARKVRTAEELQAVRDPGPHYGGVPLTDPIARRASDAGNARDITFDDIGRIAEDAQLPVLVKGILRGDDAGTAVRAGAAGVIVSNHGARQLDPVVPTADALPEIAEALAGTDAELIVDGGIRRGTHVLAALALGARAVLLGRPVLYALAIGGASLVQRLIEELTAELVLAMTLAGVRTPTELTPDLVARVRCPGR